MTGTIENDVYQVLEENGSLTDEQLADELDYEWGEIKTALNRLRMTNNVSMSIKRTYTTE